MITNLVLVAVGTGFLVLGFGLIVTRVKANFRFWMKGEMGEAGISAASPGVLLVALSAILFVAAANMHFDVSEKTTKTDTTVARAQPSPPSTATPVPPHADTPAALPNQSVPSGPPPPPAARGDEAAIQVRRRTSEAQTVWHYAGGQPLTVAHLLEAIDTSLAALNAEQQRLQDSNDVAGIQRGRLAIQRLTELKEELAHGPRRH